SIKGIGKERMAELLIEGPTTEAKYVYAMTRPCPTIEVLAHKNVSGPFGKLEPLYTYYGATFDHVAAPSKPVIGVVQDGDTGKSIPGTIVENTYYGVPTSEPRSHDDRFHLRAATDGQGRYRITGLPLGKGNFLRASPPAGKPYLVSLKEVPESSGLDPVTV